MMETMMPEMTAVGGTDQQHLHHLQHQLSPTSMSGPSSPPPPPPPSSAQPTDTVPPASQQQQQPQQQIAPSSASAASSAALPKLNEIRCPPASNCETKVIYHLEDKDIPTMVRIPIAPSAITLRDLKAYLSLRNSSNYKFYFKARDKDCGIVKEEIFHDNTPLPFFQDKVVAYIESIEGANSPIGGSEGGSRSKHDDALPKTRHGLVSDSTFSTDHDSTTETDSMISSRRGGQYLSPRHRNYCKSSGNHHSRYGGKCGRRSGHHHSGGYDSSVVSTSDMESYVDSDDDDDDEDDYDDEDDDDEDFMEGDSEEEEGGGGGRRGHDFDDYRSDYTSTTEETSVSRQYLRKGRSGHPSSRRRSNHHHGHHKSHHHHHHYRNRNNMSRTSSTSSFSEMSYDVITVTLNLDVVNYLGISLVGQTSQKGDGGIYVSSIMKGGAVDIDGRIQPGDMILQVNDTNFSNLTNDEAVSVIREAVKKPGPIKLLVAKTWDPNPKGHFTIPRSEPVRPIDPGAWVAHTEAARAKYTSHETSLPLESTLASYNASAIGSVLPPPSAEMAAAAVASGSDRFLLSGQHHLQHHLQHHQSNSISPFSGVLGAASAPPANAYSAASSANSSSLTYPAATTAQLSMSGGSPLRGSFRAAAGMGSGQQSGLSGHSVTISSSVTTVAPAVPLSTESSLETIAGAMASPDSGLDIRDRMWLKIRIPSAFIGSDVVHWLYSYVAGFSERKDAKKVASRLLKEGFIRHTINLKNSFSEKCYYVFSEAVLHKVVAQHGSAHHHHHHHQPLESSGVSSLEEGFANSLRLTNENFQPTSSVDQLAALSQLPQQQQPGHWSTPEMMMMMGGGGGSAAATKPNSIYPTMPFMRYWDETSEIQNYGLIGPNSEEGGAGGILDNLHHSLGLNGSTNHQQHLHQHHHDPYQSDEQMSQRSGQSVLFNPTAAASAGVGSLQLSAGSSLHQHTAAIATAALNSNTMGSSGSAGSRLTNSSTSNNNNSHNQQHIQSSSTTTVVSNGNGSSNASGSGVNGGGGGGGSSNGGGSGTGNLLNHHYEDLQMNHATGSLVPVGSIPPLSSGEANEYSGHNYHNQTQHIFAQPSMFRQHRPQQLNHDEMLAAIINGDGEQQQHSPQSEGGSSSNGGSQHQQQQHCYPQVVVEPGGQGLSKGKPKKGFFNRQGSFTSGLPTPANVMRNSFRKAMGKS